jgi:plastocyanin
MMTARTMQKQTVGRRIPNGRRIRLPLVAMVSLGTVLLAAGCSSSPAAAPATTASSSAGSTGAAPSGQAEIAISNFMFVPATLTVKPGATVTVVNHDAVAHTVTASKGAFNTGDIAPGKTVTFTAPMTAGSFSYICNIHQYMTGTLIVS